MSEISLRSLSFFSDEQFHWKYQLILYMKRLNSDKLELKHKTGNYIVF